jgi:hypothetical protein
LKYDVPYEDYQKAVRAVHPEWDDEQIERAFDYVTEDKNIIDQDPEDYADLFKGDSATASNLAQGLRGAVARNLGYDAVEMLDETGTSLQILSGARSMPLPKDMTFDDATREIYESLKNPNNLSTPSPSPLEGAMDMSTDARMQRAAEQGFNVNTPVYHGTAVDFKEFDPDRSFGSQFWSTTDKAAIEAGEVGAAGRGVIKEMFQRIKNPAGWAEYDKYSTDELIARGYDGLALPDADGQITYVAFEPNQYRDVRAAFDPAKRNSANLLATTAGGTISLSALRQLMPQEEERPIE